MKTLRLQVTTPEGKLFEGEVQQVSLNTQMGEITVLPNHIPLVSVLEPGELLIKQDNKETPLAVYGGFVEINSKGELIVLADAGERVEEIDEAKAEEAAKKAEEVLKNKFNTADYEDAALNLQRELARIRIAKKWRNKGIRTSQQKIN